MTEASSLRRWWVKTLPSTFLELSEASLHTGNVRIWEGEIPKRGATICSFSWEEGQEELRGVELDPLVEALSRRLRYHPLFPGHLWFMVREHLYSLLRKERYKPFAL